MWISLIIDKKCNKGKNDFLRMGKRRSHELRWIYGGNWDEFILLYYVMNQLFLKRKDVRWVDMNDVILHVRIWG